MRGDKHSMVLLIRGYAAERARKYYGAGVEPDETWSERELRSVCVEAQHWHGRIPTREEWHEGAGLSWVGAAYFKDPHLFWAFAPDQTNGPRNLAIANFYLQDWNVDDARATSDGESGAEHLQAWPHFPDGRGNRAAATAEKFGVSAHAVVLIVQAWLKHTAPEVAK